MIDAIEIIFPLIFTSNLFVTMVKYLETEAMSKTYLRALLGLVALIGVIASSSLTGNPIDPDSVSSLAIMILQTLAVAFGAHYSYKAIKYAPSTTK